MDERERGMEGGKEEVRYVEDGPASMTRKGMEMNTRGGRETGRKEKVGQEGGRAGVQVGG